jgi:F-type H+-transporting ATPase subunit b
MKFVWPPVMKALDDRAKKIADGLAAADKAKADLVAVERRVQDELVKAKDVASDVRGSAEKQGATLIEEARVEAARLIAQAREAAEAEAGAAMQRARDSLREEVAALAVKGAQQILSREINAQAHAELLANLKKEL